MLKTRDSVAPKRPKFLPDDYAKDHAALDRFQRDGAPPGTEPLQHMRHSRYQRARRTALPRNGVCSRVRHFANGSLAHCVCQRIAHREIASANTFVIPIGPVKAWTSDWRR